MPHGTHFISENNSIHLKQKGGSVATRAPPVILIFFLLNQRFRDQSMETSIFIRLNSWHDYYNKGQVHQGT